MKPKTTLRTFLLGCSSLLAASSLHAAPVTWDITPGTVGAGDSAITGGTGTWDTTNGNWTVDAGVNNIAWVTGSDTAVFAGTVGTITADAGGIAAGALDITGAYSFTGGAITASGGLTKAGGGTMTILNNNAITGNIVITGGELQLGSNNNTGSLNGGSFAGNISIASGSTFRDRSNNTVTMGGVISGDGILHKDGGGTMTLTGANTYTGQTIIRASGAGGPTLSVSSLNSVTTPPQQPSSSLGVPVDAAAGTIVLGNGGNIRSCTLIYTGSGETTDRVMSISFNAGAKQEIRNSGSGLLKFTSTFPIARSSGSNSGRLTLGGDADGEIEGGFSSTSTPANGIIPGDLWKDGAGTWTLGGTTTADDLQVTSGTLVIDVGATLNSTDFDTSDGATGAVVVSGGTLTVDGLLDFVVGTISGGTIDGSGSIGFDIDGTTFDSITMTSGSFDATGLTVAVTESGAGLTQSEYILVDATGGGTLTGPFAGLTGAPGYELNYDTVNQVKLVSTGGSAYGTWSGGSLPGDDDNNDGVANGVAWALDAADPDENAIGLLPDLDNTTDATYLIFSFNRSDEANDDPNTMINVEYGNDLVGWTDAVDDGDNVIITETPGSPTDAVEVKLKRSSIGAGGKVFARLKVTVTP